MVGLNDGENVCFACFKCKPIFKIVILCKINVYLKFPV